MHYFYALIIGQNTVPPIWLSQPVTTDKRKRYCVKITQYLSNIICVLRKPNKKRVEMLISQHLHFYFVKI